MTRPRRWPFATFTAVPTGMLLLAGIVASCDREAELYDTPSLVSIAPTTVPRPDGPLDAVEVDFDAAGLPACATRADSRCSGGTDFPCMPEVFVLPAITACFEADGCRVDGWVEVDLGTDGCAEELRMEDPNPEFVACMAEKLGLGRCICGESTEVMYLGLGNDGCVSGPNG